MSTVCLRYLISGIGLEIESVDATSIVLGLVGYVINEYVSNEYCVNVQLSKNDDD